MKPFLTIGVEDARVGHYVYPIWRGKPQERIEHLPWFAASVKPDGVKHVVAARRAGIFLGFIEEHFRYEPIGESYIVYVDRASNVKSAASEVAARGGRAGLYNVKYRVRAALDVQARHGYGLLGYETPLMFLRNSDMIAAMEQAVEDASKLKLLVFDIEVAANRGFPRVGDPIISITYAAFTAGEDVSDPSFVDRIEYIVNEDVDMRGSVEVVERFVEAVKAFEPDFIVGFNSVSFDARYLRPFLNHDELGSEVARVGGLWVPHIDLLIVRKSLGAALKLRSQVGMALDEVAVEAIKNVMKGAEWVLDSRYIEAERRMHHRLMTEMARRGEQLFYDYIVADVLLTSIIASAWFYPLVLLSLLTGIPVDVLQALNPGQTAEYLFAEYLHRLGLHPELRTRKYGYSRVEREPQNCRRRAGDWCRVFTRGKVYTLPPGVYGGGEWAVVELDFAQLYPTFMMSTSIDPTAIRVIEDAGRGQLDKPLGLGDYWILLREPSGAPRLLRVEVGYGPLSWLIYKMYKAREETKRLKRRAKEEGRPALAAVDQAVKILNNSAYGSFSKSRGNLVNEALAATVFWVTQKMLYDVIDLIEGEVSERLGVKLKVIYGDTDSAYVLAPRSIDPERIEEEVNRAIRERYGPAFKMELEGVYDYMIIPRRKTGSEASAKTYVAVKGGKIAKFMGEFFKLPLPLAIRDRLEDFYNEIIRRGVRTWEELREVMKEYIRAAPPYKAFVRKGVSSFTKEDGEERRLKRLNKQFHYAALVTACEEGNPAASIESRVEDGDSIRAVCRVRVDELEAQQAAVIVHYLPSVDGSSRRFSLYAGRDGDSVEVVEVEVDKIGYNDDKLEITIAYRARRRRIPLDVLPRYAVERVKRVALENIYVKLVSTTGMRNGGLDSWISG